VARTQVSVAVALTTVGVALIGAQALRPRTPSDGVDAESRLAGDDDLRCRAAELDARIADTARRLSEKRAVAVALVRGELTLRRAADRFRAVIGADPAFFDYLRRCRPGATDDELLYRNVVGFARNVLADWPDPPEEVLDRLDAELDAAFPARSDPTRAGGP
jgi:hypothetical protein